MQGKCKEWPKHSRRPEMGQSDVASNWRSVVRSAASPIGNYDPSCEIWSGMEGASTKTCAKHCQIFSMRYVRARHSGTTIFVIFRTLYAFPEIKIPTRPTPLVAPCGRTILKFFPVSHTMNEKSQSDTQMILLTRTCSCDYIYIHTNEIFFCIFKVWDC